MASFRLHYLVEEPVTGSIPTAPMPGLLAFIGRKTKLRAACDPEIKMSDAERGTGEPWAVHCDACKATQVYKDTYYPRPGGEEDRITHADGAVPGGTTLAGRAAALDREAKIRATFSAGQPASPSDAVSQG